VMMQGLPPRGGGPKEAWIKRASRWTKTEYKAPAPDERATYRKVRIHQGAKRRFGDCARKAAELTPGDLLRVAWATEVVERQPDRGAEVSIGQSIRPRRRPEREGAVSRP
jgi:hypothetical protein